MSSNQEERKKRLVDKDKDDNHYENIFGAGKVKTSERNLHRTGIRGKKIWLFLAVLIILLIICIINLVILAVIYSVLRLDKDGVESLSFFEDGKLRWTQSSDLESVIVYNNEIGGFKDSNLTVEATQSKIVLHGGPSIASSQVHVSDENTTITGKKGFKFVDPFIEKEVISFDGSSSQFLQESVYAQSISINTVQSHRIVSNEHQNLTMSSSKNILVKGNEGIKVDGKSLRFDGRKDISIISTDEKKIVFDSPEIFLKLTRNPAPPFERYKLCICKGSHKLFRVKQTSTSLSCTTKEDICK